MIRLSSYIFYSSIFVCNIIRIDGEYWNGNEIETRIIFQMGSMPPWITHDGSGMTGKIELFIDKNRSEDFHRHGFNYESYDYFHNYTFIHFSFQGL
jgi:hypothetical protein